MPVAGVEPARCCHHGILSFMNSFLKHVIFFYNVLFFTHFSGLKICRTKKVPVYRYNSFSFFCRTFVELFVTIFMGQKSHVQVVNFNFSYVLVKQVKYGGFLYKNFLVWYKKYKTYNPLSNLLKCTDLL